MRILLRSGKTPFEVYSARRTYSRNIIGNNSGNLIFSQAVHRALSVPGAHIHSTHMRARVEEAGRINDAYDVFVVPLANAFRRTFMPQLTALTELIERLTIPVVVVGVGAQSDVDYSLESMKPLEQPVKRFVAAVLERSATIGVRGEFTRDYLRDLGFGDVEVIGCPSMFMYGPALSVARRTERITADSPLAVGISPYVKEMRAVARAHQARYPGLVYIGQDIKTLGRVLGPKRGGTQPDPSKGPDAWQPLFDEGRVRFFLDPRTWLEFLAGRHFAYGTRIHGAIAALLAGTPATVLAHDSRTLELSRYHQIPHVPRSRITKDLDLAQLHDEADLGALHRGHADRFQVYASFLRHNGLSHVFEPGQAAGAEAFDQRVLAMRYPGPVRPDDPSSGSLSRLDDTLERFRLWR